MDPAPPRVLISYSHDSAAHQTRVLDLAQRLRHDGIDARLDRFVTAPEAGWARWMIDEIEAAHRVIMVCTPTYRRRCEGRERAGVGNGASFEGLILLQHLYDHGGHNHGRKLIPVYYPDPALPDPLEAITPPLRPTSRYALDAEYDALRRDILGLAAITPAPLGVADLRSPGIDEFSMTAEDALYNLLLSLFGADEFRRWIRHNNARSVIAEDLPGAIASKSALVTEAIEALDRHRLIDATFFADLRAARPRRADEINQVEAMWKIHPTSAQAQAPIVNPTTTTTNTTNNNQSGGIFAPGATFNIKGDFIQGDKHEVHTHNTKRPKRPRNHPIDD